MRVRVEQTVTVGDDFRRAINMHYGLPGLASREDVKRWVISYGASGDDDLMFDLEQARERGEEPQYP